MPKDNGSSPRPWPIRRPAARTRGRDCPCKPRCSQESCFGPRRISPRWKADREVVEVTLAVTCPACNSLLGQNTEVRGERRAAVRSAIHLAVEIHRFETHRRHSRKATTPARIPTAQIVSGSPRGARLDASLIAHRWRVLREIDAGRKTRLEYRTQPCLRDSDRSAMQAVGDVAVVGEAGAASGHQRQVSYGYGQVARRGARRPGHRTPDAG